VLTTALKRQIASLFGGRIIAFDIAAAEAYAELVIRARRQGYAISVTDGQIAAVAASRSLRVATRDEMPFQQAGLTIINPWKA
jgi:hypothetical protein